MKTFTLFLTLLLGVVSPTLAAEVPESTIWDHQGVNAFGDRFRTSLMIRHGHLVIVLPKGGQLDYGAVTLNGYNEFEVSPANFKAAFPAIETMTYKFSDDFSSVTETDIMNYGGRCVAGSCDNNVETVTYLRR